jgi:hypothetical protein
LSALRLAVDVWLSSNDAGELHELLDVGFRRLRGGLSG